MKKATNIALIVGVACALAGGAIQARQDATGALPDAKPGECYAKVVIPATYETQTEELQVSEASQRIEVIPAKYEAATEKVMIKDASYRLIPVPAVYESVTEKMEVKPASTYWSLSAKGKTRRASSSLVAYAKQAGLTVDSAEAGQCFIEYYNPAQFRTETETLTKKEAGESVSIIPAKYEMVEEKVLVRDASSRVVKVPAVYGTETDKVQISAATSVWKKGRGLKERIDGSTGEIMCLVEVPAQYKTVTRRVVKTPATVKTIEIPAEYSTQKVRKLVSAAEEVRKAIPAQYEDVTRRIKVSDESVAWFLKGSADAKGTKTGNKMCLNQTPATFKTVTRQVLKSSAASKRVEIPAEYKTVKVSKLIQPAGHNAIEIPAKFQTITKKVKVTDERLEWRQVLCETNTTTDLIRRLQTSLREKGFHPGPIDGILGRYTLAAVDKYQASTGLERGGLTLRTLEELKIDANS